MSNQLNKVLKILLTIEFILIIAIIVFALINNKEITGYAVKDNLSIEETDFKILTKAVCEERDEHIFCHDELFVKCNDKEYAISNDSLNNLIECNNIKLNLSDAKVKGDGFFVKENLKSRKTKYLNIS